MNNLQNNINAIENLETYELVQLHNEYCDAYNTPDEMIYSMDEFDDIFYGYSPIEVAELVSGTGFDVADEYFTYERGVYFTSDFSRVMNNIFIEELAEYTMENDYFNLED